MPYTVRSSEKLRKVASDFETKAMLYLKIYDGRSIKERWNELILINIGGISVEDWDKSWFD